MGMIQAQLSQLYYIGLSLIQTSHLTGEPHEIDNDSGVGLHLDVDDINGDRLPDIIVANKKGVHYFEQI